MSTYAPPAAAGRGPALSSGPLQVGADGKPLSKSDADAKPPTSARGAADFGQEETSAFYRNASYQPSANASSIQQPTWTLALKPLSIAPFDGDIRAYPTFRNHFLEIIESQPGLNSRHKLQYLLQYLRGEPYRMASSFMITDGNYFRVLERLEETYGDRGTLVWHLNDMLHSLSPPSANANDLRVFHDESARLVAELRQSGENPDANSVIAQNLLSKLPHSVRLEVIRRSDQNRPTISVILEILRDHLRVQEATDAMSLNASAWASSGLLRRGDQRSYSRNPPSSSQRYGNYMVGAQVVVKKCVFCSQPHWSTQCPLYDTLEKRIRRVRLLNKCFLCLNGSHRIASCPKRTNEPCRYCNQGQHHQSLCPVVIRSFEERRPDPMSATKKGPATQKVQNVAAAAPPASEAKPISPSRSAPQESCSVSWLKPTQTGESTVRNLCLPSAHSSESGLSNSTQNATKPSQGPRTDPDGLLGTSRPTTDAHESMISKDVHASDASELLLTQKCLRTDRCSTPDEMVQFDRNTGCGSGESIGFPDAYRKRELHGNEDTSPTNPSGPLNDSARVSIVEPTPSGQLAGQMLRSAPDKPTTRFANKIFRREDDASTPLLECLIATAKNPWTDDTADAVIVFDRYRSSSLITKELVYALKLPASRTPTADEETFTGYNTSIDLLLPGGAKLSLEHLATGRLPKEVCTVLLDEKLLAALRRSALPPEVIYAQPHLLIGMDEMLRLQYSHGPRLRDNLFSVHTRLGVALGGRLEADPDSLSEASTSSRSCSFAWTNPEDAEEPPRHRKLPKALKLDVLRQWLNINPVPQFVYPPTYSVGDTSVTGTNELLEPSSSLQIAPERPSSSRMPGVLPQSTQKQLTPKPLDTQPLLLPTLSSTNGGVEVVSAAYYALTPPRPS